MSAADDVVDEVAHLPRLARSRVVELILLHVGENVASRAERPREVVGDHSESPVVEAGTCGTTYWPGWLMRITAKVAPCGSASTEKRPGSMSIGGTRTVPPSSSHFATDTSVSSTAKYTSQWGGTSAGTMSGICIMPATLLPFSLNSVYARGP